MGLFDLFTNDVAQNAANIQSQGLANAYEGAKNWINQGSGALQTNYTAGLQPFLQNYNTAGAGVDQLKNLLGLNGAAGSQSAMTALQNMPGYQFALQQGDNAINAQAAATGQNASGNQALALSKYNQGLASQNYNNYVSQLMPFLGASQGAASGIAGVDTGLGQGLNQNFNTLAGLNWQTSTGQANANANAALAQNQANQNIFNGVMGLGSAALGIFSDERLKENIEPVGELYDGTGVYRYNYKGDDVPRIGVMAQEVEKTRPDAVVEIGGFKAVDYGKATDIAASLAKFMDEEPQVSPANDYDLSRFLKAA